MAVTGALQHLFRNGLLYFHEAELEKQGINVKTELL